MLFFTQYKTIRGLLLSPVSLSRCITRQDVCVQQSYAGLPFSNFKQTQIAHQRTHIRTTKTQEACVTNKNIGACLFELKR